MDINIKNKSFQTLLHFVARSGMIAPLRSLLADKDIKPNERDNRGNTPLHIIACNRAYTSGVEALFANEVVKRNADVSFNVEGYNPLHNAILSNWSDNDGIKMIEILLGKSLYASKPCSSKRDASGEIKETYEVLWLGMDPNAKTLAPIK